MAAIESIEEDWPWVWACDAKDVLDWKVGLSEDEIEAQTARQGNMPVPITDNLYLADRWTVRSVELLEAAGITSVLNAAGPYAIPDETLEEYERRGIRYKRIDAKDELGCKLLKNHWHEAYDFLRSSLYVPNGKCVVNCMAGLNRSGTIAAAYYMVTTRTPVLETVRHVRMRRSDMALCNAMFHQQLVALARTEGLLGAMPGTEGSIVRREPPNPPSSSSSWGEHWILESDDEDED